MNWLKKLLGKEFNAESMRNTLQATREREIKKLREEIKHDIKDKSKYGYNETTVWCDLPEQIIDELKEKGFKIKYENRIIPYYEIFW